MGRLRKAHYNASEDMKDVEKAVAIGILGERMDRFLAVVYDVADLLREPITEVDTGVMERKGQSPQGHIRETLDYENRMVETSGVTRWDKLYTSTGSDESRKNVQIERRYTWSRGT